jgi:hypothetical protein
MSIPLPAAAVQPLRPIPTKYNGVQFRSRLEARWAAFFDRAGWRWEYEPPETDGWIPDFLLIGAQRSVRIEVKPINWFGTERTQLEQQAVQHGGSVWQYALRARAVPIDVDVEDVLLLGAYPHDLGYGSTMLGLFSGRAVDVIDRRRRL